MSTKELQPVRGTHDLLADAFATHQWVISRTQAVGQLYGYGRIDTPIFEFSEVFHRAVGETSDIVSKETYTFISSTMVKEIARLGGDISAFVPDNIAAALRQRLGQIQQP